MVWGGFSKFLKFSQNLGWFGVVWSPQWLLTFAPFRFLSSSAREHLIDDPKAQFEDQRSRQPSTNMIKTIYVPGSKLLMLGMVIPPLIRNPYTVYITPYYWVDDHPLLYGNNGSLDSSDARRSIHTVRMPLTQVNGSLDPGTYVRVHL